MLSLPLAATSVIGGALFQLVDLEFVSSLGEEATTAVVVTNQSLRQLFFMLVMGASFGAQGLVARCVGAGDQAMADHVAGQVVLLGALLSTGVALAGLFFAEPLLAAMQVSPAVLAIGVPYARLTLLLAFGIAFGVLSNAILNGAGDATATLRISLIQTAVSLVAEWCLIFGHLGLPRFGVLGVALGVGVGQLVGIALALRVLLRGERRVRLHLRHLRPDPALLRRIAGLAWPPALQMVGGFLVTVLFLRWMGGFGHTAQAAYSIGIRLGMIGPMLAMPLAGATSIVIGQCLGAGRVPRAWQALRVGVAANVVLLWTFAAGLALFRHRILAAFADDPEVIRIGAECLLWQSAGLLAWGFYFVFFRALQGAGDVRVPMWISLVNSLVSTLALGAWLSRLYGPTGLFAASAIGSWVVTLATGAWLATGHWTRRAGFAAPPRAAAAALQ